jgi:hypothetical protein
MSIRGDVYNHKKARTVPIPLFAPETRYTVGVIENSVWDRN